MIQSCLDSSLVKNRSIRECRPGRAFWYIWTLSGSSVNFNLSWVSFNDSSSLKLQDFGLAEQTLLSAGMQRCVQKLKAAMHKEGQASQPAESKFNQVVIFNEIHIKTHFCSYCTRVLVDF